MNKINYSQKISERQWNLPDKGERESKREKIFIDDLIQKAHIEKEILNNLEGVKTVFDGGAGAGRFSIMLAKLGIKVTHFDISEPMIEKAKELAIKERVENNITFVKGALEDLSRYKDDAFDMVMSFDAPISYTYPNQEIVIKELIRITKKKYIISVSSRLGSLPYFSNPIQKIKYIIDEKTDDSFARWYLDNQEKLVKEFMFDKNTCESFFKAKMDDDIKRTIAAYKKGEAPWPISYYFMPDELKNILQANGLKNIKLAGPGAYARALPKEVLMKIIGDEDQRRDFLDFCYIYDSNQYVCGMGKDNLLAYGEK